MITVRGVELDFSFTNRKHIRAWNKARKDVQEKYADIEEFQGTGVVDLEKYADLLEKATYSIMDLFDGIFGDGTANQLFGPEVNDFEIVVDAYREFEEAIEVQSIAFSQKANRYAPVVTQQ